MIDHGDRVGIPSRDRCRRGVAVAMFGGGEPRVESREFASVIVERGGGDAAGPAVDGQPSERAAEGRSGIAPIVAQVTVLPFPAAGRIVRDEFDDGAIAGLVGVGDVKVEQRVVFEGRRVTTVPRHQDDGGAEFRSVRQRIVEGRNPSATGTGFRTSKGPSTNTMCRSVSAKSWTNPSSGIGIVAGPCSRPPRSTIYRRYASKGHLLGVIVNHELDTLEQLVLGRLRFADEPWLIRSERAAHWSTSSPRGH